MIEDKLKPHLGNLQQTKNIDASRHTMRKSRSFGVFLNHEDDIMRIHTKKINRQYMKNKTFVRDSEAFLTISNGVFIPSPHLNGYLVSYKYAEQQQEIRFCGEKPPYSNKIHTIRVLVLGRENETAIKNLYDKLTEAGYCPSLPPSAINNDRFVFQVFEKDKQKLVLALKIMKQFLSIQTIMKEIFTGLELKSIADPVVFYENLELLMKEGRFAEAISQAQDIECDDSILWNLVNLLEKYEAYPEALHICQEIPPENPYYKAANVRAINIIQKYEIDTINVKNQDKQYFLEAKILCMLRISDPDYQTVLDKHYSQLCGASPIVPLLKNIGTNEETLMNAGKIISSLNQELRALKREHENLWKKINSSGDKSNITLENNKDIFFQNPDNNRAAIIPKKPEYPIPVLPCAII